MNSNEIVDLLDPPEPEIQMLSGTCSSLEEQLDEYIKATQLEITNAMRADLLDIYRGEHGKWIAAKS